MKPAYPAIPLFSRLTAAVLGAVTSLAIAQAPPVAPPSAAAPAAARPPAAELKKFDEVIKEAKESKGFFTTWEKDEKVWLEIKPEQLDMPFFMSYNITHSIGERGLYGSQMGGRYLAYFKRVGNSVMLVAQNHQFRADAGLAINHALKQSFSESLISQATVLSLPHAERKSFLIEANTLLIKDIPGMATRLEAAFRIPYGLDSSASHFTQVNNGELQTSLNLKAHYNIAKLPAPPAVPPTVPGTAASPPMALADARSMFMGYVYNFAQLPQPMAPRVADARVGYFTTSFTDFTSDDTASPRRHFANRWRLEKADPAAALSAPKQPITYWIDKNVPEKYRESVRAGIVEWNKAFEKIGFKNAVVAQQQTEQDTFDTLDARHATVRWFTGSDVGFAIGPSHVDPRSGEILDADIGMSDVFARGARRTRVEEVGRTYEAQKAQAAHSHAAHAPIPGQEGQHSAALCNYAHEAAAEMDFALDVLESRGLDPNGPEADKMAQDYVMNVIMHEVGHTLGLRHNFRSSMIYSSKELSDPEFAKTSALTGSVMDYVPFNLAAKGEKQGAYVSTTLGHYDNWAIEYGYKPIAPGQEKVELAKITARSTEPKLAFATDEDAGIGEGPANGMDPEVNRFDIGDDPLAYFKKRLALSRELWVKLQNKSLANDESYVVLRRNFNNGFTALFRVIPAAAKYVGGVVHLRDNAGTGRAPFTPVPAAKQRDALNTITQAIFVTESFKFQPEFMAKLGVDHLDRLRGLNMDANIGNVINPLVSVNDSVLAVQRNVLDQFMSDAVAKRIIDSAELTGAKDVFKLSELYDGLQRSIWSEARTGAEVTTLRRNLQREHLKRVVNILLKPSSAGNADMVSLQRQNARQLAQQLRAAQNRAALSRESRAHYAESANSLDEALKAPLQRSGI